MADVWNQYDGVLNQFPEKRFFQKLTFFWFNYYEKRLESDLKLAVKAFFPKWKHFQKDGEELSPADVMNSLTTLYRGLRKNYYMTCKKWRKESDFIEDVGKVIYQKLSGKQVCHSPLDILKKFLKQAHKLNISASLHDHEHLS